MKNYDVESFPLLLAVLDVFVFCSGSCVEPGHIFRLLARPDFHHRLVLGRDRYDEASFLVSSSSFLESRHAETVRMGSQSSSRSADMWPCVLEDQPDETMHMVSQSLIPECRASLHMVS